MAPLAIVLTTLALFLQVSRGPGAKGNLEDWKRTGGLYSSNSGEGARETGTLPGEGEYVTSKLDWVAL
jgi:hypothetical protein